MKTNAQSKTRCPKCAEVATLATEIIEYQTRVFDLSKDLARRDMKRLKKQNALLKILVVIGVAGSLAPVIFGAS